MTTMAILAIGGLMMLTMAIWRNESDVLLKRRWTALLAGEAGTKRTGENDLSFKIQDLEYLRG